jgi:hypothetical protein
VRRSLYVYVFVYLFTCLRAAWVYTPEKIREGAGKGGIVWDTALFQVNVSLLVLVLCVHVLLAYVGVSEDWEGQCVRACALCARGMCFCWFVIVCVRVYLSLPVSVYVRHHATQICTYDCGVVCICVPVHRKRAEKSRRCCWFTCVSVSVTVLLAGSCV